MLPFTREQFIAIFADYNTAVWPAQIVACALGLGMVAAVLRPSPAGHRFISGGLALMWGWTGIAYHGLFFSAINKAALGFGVLFVLQGALFAYFGVVRRQLSFGTSRGPSGWLGWALVLYAAVLYPLLGVWTGHVYPAMPFFGITPCPVTLFTFGLLLLTTAPVPRWLLAIPFAWSLVGGSAAFLLGVAPDWPLLFSGMAAGVLILRDQRTMKTAVS
jgi:Family of unknown function (DUF6064)